MDPAHWAIINDELNAVQRKGSRTGQGSESEAYSIYCKKIFHYYMYYMT